MPIRSGILSFGLVAIPVKVYPATKDQAVRFHLIHKKCGSRLGGFARSTMKWCRGRTSSGAPQSPKTNTCR
jgi:hypothetical protein